MTSNELKIWATDGSGEATPLETAHQMESELLLEDTLVNYPDMLMPGLTLVGRQNRTEGGPLDLLGVDQDGRLALFELKRGSLNRDAVAQIVDYGSWLESMEVESLAQHIASYSGSRCIDKIEDFAGWYDERWTGQELSTLLPIRLFLVGLGVDDTTIRIVRFLAGKNVDISLLTFLGFTHAGQTLLAKQVQVEAPEEPEEKSRSSRGPGRAQRRQILEQQINDQTADRPEARELWDAVLEMFRVNFPGSTGVVGRGASDWSKRRLRIRPSGRGRDIAAI